MYRSVNNNAEFRNNIVSKINIILNNLTNSKNLEKGIFNYSLKEASQKKLVKKWENNYFVVIYVDRVKTILKNLKNNDYILNLINTNAIKIHEIAFMTHQEMRPDLWKTLISIKQEKDKLKFENSIEASTDTFTCRKCKSTRCTYYALQCRCADEPMTLFVTCIDCGQRFKTQ